MGCWQIHPFFLSYSQHRPPNLQLPCFTEKLLATSIPSMCQFTSPSFPCERPENYSTGPSVFNDPIAKAIKQAIQNSPAPASRISHIKFGLLTAGLEPSLTSRMGLPTIQLVLITYLDPINIGLKDYSTQLLSALISVTNRKLLHTHSPTGNSCEVGTQI